jgi:hypothetical protein
VYDSVSKQIVLQDYKYVDPAIFKDLSIMLQASSGFVLSEEIEYMRLTIEETKVDKATI